MGWKDRIPGLGGKKGIPKSIPGKRVSYSDDAEKEIEEKLEYDRAHRIGFGRFIRHPLKVLTEQPINILIVCAPVSLVFFLISTVIMIRQYGLSVMFTTTIIDDIAVISILIAIGPLAILQTRESKRINNLEEALPNFFRDLAGMNDSGMTLPNAVHLVSAGEYSTLTPFIRKMDSEMSWNVPFVQAMYRFGQRLRTPLADRSVDLIAKASRAGGDASEVLRAAANDTYEFVSLKTERNNNMMIYVVIVLVSFLVFLFVIFILVTTFLTTMATAAQAGGQSGPQFIKNLNLFFYKRLFAHAAMIQGIFSGLVAGQMGEGSAIAGLKYSAIMLLIAWISFRFFV
ncbi:MAG: type II secretion system F family protein [Methanomicrobiales archaeon]